MAVRMILAVESETDLLVANPLGELWPLRSLPRMGKPPSGSLAVWQYGSMAVWQYDGEYV
jgi:hypothetical protein